MKCWCSAFTQVNCAAVYLGHHEMVVKEVGNRRQSSTLQAIPPSHQRFASDRSLDLPGQKWAGRWDPFTRWGGLCDTLQTLLQGLTQRGEPCSRCREETQVAADKDLANLTSGPCDRTVSR